MRRYWKPTAAIAAAVIMAIILLLSPISTAHTQDSSASWQQVDLSNILHDPVHLSQVQLVDSTTAWLVGNDSTDQYAATEGHIYKLDWRDNKWGVSERYSFPYHITYLKATIDGVWAVASGEVRGACCEVYNQILHKDANGWHAETGQMEGVGINTISLLPGGQEGWAAGGIEIPDCHFTCSESYVLHYSKGSWARDNTASNFGRYVASIEFAGGVGYAVGETIHKYDGMRWMELAVPELPQPPNAPPDEEICPDLYFRCLSFSKVEIVSPDDFWVFGSRYYTLSASEPVLLHMKDRQWQTILPGASMLDCRPANTESLLASDFSMDSDGTGFLAMSPDKRSAGKALPQIIRVSPDGSLSYEQIPQLEHVALTGISNIEGNYALAVGEQNVQIGTGNDLTEIPSNAVLLSYGFR